MSSPPAASAASAVLSRRRNISTSPLPTLTQATVTTRPRWRIGVGAHPWWATDVDGDEAARIAAQAPYIGEVGLDFGKAHAATRDRQVENFSHIAAAAPAGALLSIHAVRSADTVLDLLEDAVFRQQRGTFPCAGRRLLLLGRPAHVAITPRARVCASTAGGPPPARDRLPRRGWRRRPRSDRGYDGIRPARRPLSHRRPTWRQSHSTRGPNLRDQRASPRFER